MGSLNKWTKILNNEENFLLFAVSFLLLMDSLKPMYNIKNFFFIDIPRYRYRNF